MYLSVSGAGFNINPRADLRLPRLINNRLGLNVIQHKVPQFAQYQTIARHRQLQSPEQTYEKPASPDRFYKYLTKQVQSQKGMQRQQVQQLVIHSSMILVAKSIKLSQEPHSSRYKDRIVKPIEESNEYKYYLGTGNNHPLIQRIMDTRIDWVATKDNSSMFVNFKWQQWQRGYKYERLTQNSQYKQMVNHFEFHSEISNKQYLFRNLSYFCEQNKLNIFDYVPITFIIDFNDESVDVQFTHFIKSFDKYANKDKKIDQLPKKLVELKKKIKLTVSSQNERKLQFYPAKLPKSQIGNEYLWLLKPTFMNRGMGIHVVNDLDTLTSFMIEYQEGHTTNQEEEEPKKKNVIKAHSFIVQKYIEQPFLINQRKFDIRVWALVTQDLNCYFFKEGYIRTSCEEYRTDDLDNQFIHLTNNAIQKNSEKYGEFEDGNQLSFDDFQNYIDSQGIKMDFYATQVPKMKQLINHTLQSVKRKINLNQRKFCMEIFGYDFIIDSDFKTWLIEVNTNPCIEESSQILKVLLPRMIDDAFKLTLDVVFPPKLKSEEPVESLFPVPKYDNFDNLWEMLGTLESPKHRVASQDKL